MSDLAVAALFNHCLRYTPLSPFLTGLRFLQVWRGCTPSTHCQTLAYLFLLPKESATKFFAVYLNFKQRISSKDEKMLPVLSQSLKSRCEAPGRDTGEGQAMSENRNAIKE